MRHPEKDEPQKVVIYVRYSDEMQSPRSAEDQERECRQYAEGQGWVVVGVQRDVAVRAGAIAGRLGYQRALASARSGEFDVLLVEEMSRFSRDFLAGIASLAELKALGVQLADTTNGPIDLDTLEGQLKVAFGFASSQQETKKLGERSKRGLRGKILRGFSAGGQAPYGFDRAAVFSDVDVDVDGRPKRVGVRFEPSPTEAPIVQRIFREYDEGKSKHGIVKGLNHDGIPTKRAGRTRLGRKNSGTWAPPSVKRMLGNELYIGIRTWNRESRSGEKLRSGKKRQHPNPKEEWERVENFAPPLIDKDLWDRVQQRLAEDAAKWKKQGNARGHTQYLLSGLIKCAECPANFIITRHRRGASQYCCSFHTARGNSVCKNKVEVPQPALEQRVKAVLDVVAKDPDALRELVAVHNREIGSANEQQLVVVHALEARRDTLVAERERLVEAIAGGTGSPGAIVKAIEKRETEVAELDVRVEEARSLVQPYLMPRVAAVRDYVTGAASVFEDDITRDRSFLERVIDGIYIYSDGSIVLRFQEDSLFAPVVAYHLDLNAGGAVVLPEQRRQLLADHAKTAKAQGMAPSLTEVVMFDSDFENPVVVCRRPGSTFGDPVRADIVKTPLPPPDPKREAERDARVHARHPDLSERVVEVGAGGVAVTIYRRPRSDLSDSTNDSADAAVGNRGSILLGTLNQ